MLMAYLKSVDNRRNASFAVNPVKEIPGIEEELGLQKHDRHEKKSSGKGGSK
jgi:hypothetical protein